METKASQLHTKIANETGGLNASNGWFSVTDSNPLVQKFQEKVQGHELTSAQIYYADDSGVIYKIMPDKALENFKETSAPDGKQYKE